MADNLSDIVENEPATADPARSFHAALVGDGRKYTSDEELARGYTNAELHIKELRDDLETERKNNRLTQEVLEELRKTPAQTNTSAQEAQDNSASTSATQTVDVKEVVREAITEERAVNTAQANVDRSMELLDEKYGSREAGLAAVRNYMGGDGAKKGLVDQISKSDPESFRDLILSKVSPTTPNEPNTPGIKEAGSPAAIQANSGELTWTECRRIKKEDPSLYQSAAFRKKMEETATRYQEANQDFYIT